MPEPLSIVVVNFNGTVTSQKSVEVGLDVQGGGRNFSAYLDYKKGPKVVKRYRYINLLG
jgi:hypothetical protein